MPCVAIPLPDIPELSGGLAFATPAPSLTTPDALLCCNVPSITITAPSVAGVVPMPAAIVEALASARKAYIAFKAQLVLDCPRL